MREMSLSQPCALHVHNHYKVEFPSRSAVFAGPETQRPNAVTSTTAAEPEKDSPAIVKNGRPANYMYLSLLPFQLSP